MNPDSKTNDPVNMRRLLTDAETGCLVLRRIASRMDRDAAKLARATHECERKRAEYLATKAKAMRKLIADSTAAAHSLRKRLSLLDGQA